MFQNRLGVHSLTSTLLDLACDSNLSHWEWE
jgi:hypothetical protein